MYLLVGNLYRFEVFTHYDTLKANQAEPVTTDCDKPQGYLKSQCNHYIIIVYVQFCWYLAGDGPMLATMWKVSFH